MSKPVTITRFEAENVKRVKAIGVIPEASGLTIIGGKNNQGKTSVLDAIAWALGGDKFKPSEPRRDGSATPPALHVELSNGLVVERKGKNSDLKVIDPSGNKAGQSLLNSFVEQLALDLPKFLNSTSKDKAKTLLQIIGVGDKLFELQQAEQQLYNERTAIGQIRDQKQAAADELPTYPDAPTEPVSATELIKQQQEILARNGENHKKRELASSIVRERNDLMLSIKATSDELERLKALAADKSARLEALTKDLEIALKTAEELQDESTEALEHSLAEIDAINQQVRVNQAKAVAQDEAETYKAQYDDLTGRINDLRASQMALLEGANLPLPGLSVDADGELTFNAVKWDGMSASEQLRVATAIIRKLNPDCGFVLLDKLEQLDTSTLQDFGQWAKSEQLQIIATRVSMGSECSILIEDGYGVEPRGVNELQVALNNPPASSIEATPAAGEQNTQWKAGQF